MKNKRKKELMVAAMCIAIFISCSFFRTAAIEDDLLSLNIEALTNEDTGTFKYPTAHAYKMTCNADLDGRKKCKVKYWDCQGSGYGCNPTKCPDHNHEL